MPRKVTSVCGGLALALLTLASVSQTHATTAAPHGVSPFDTALASAVANLSTPEGQQFDYDIGVAFNRGHIETMHRCASGPDALGKFVLVMRLAADGTVEQAMVRPETAATRCIRDGVTHGRFPAPTRAAYWVRMEFEVQ